MSVNLKAIIIIMYLCRLRQSTIIIAHISDGVGCSLAWVGAFSCGSDINTVAAVARLLLILTMNRVIVTSLLLILSIFSAAWAHPQRRTGACSCQRRYRRLISRFTDYGRPME